MSRDFLCLSRPLLMVIFILTQSCQVAGQVSTDVKSAQKAYEKGVTAVKKGNLVQAETFFLKANEADPDWIDPHIKLAALYFELERYDQAKPYFQNALNIDSTSNPLLYYKLGQIAWREEDYIQAASYMSRFVGHNPRNAVLAAKALKYKRDALFLSEHKEVKKVTIEALPEAINTVDLEYLPSLPAAEDLMVFTRRVHGQEDFYVSRFADNRWQESVPLVDLNTTQNEGAHCLSADGKNLFFTACHRRDAVGSCDLYYSVLRNGKWSQPVNMGEQINSRHWDGQPSISADGSTLYFSSERPGGKGGRDLWFAKRKGRGWTKPMNLSALNTSSNEEAPFLHAAGQQLYFMSDGHPGYGGTDLFYCAQSDQEWKDPVNMGTPINTQDDEGALHINLEGTTAYFAKSVSSSQDQTPQIDIFKFDLPENMRPTPATYVNISVRDRESKKVLQSVVHLVDLQTQKTITRTMTDSNGQLLLCLPVGKDFGLNVSKDKYAFYSDRFNQTDINSRFEPRDLTVLLWPIVQRPDEPSEPIVLNNIFFESGSATLLPESNYELENLFKLLAANDEMKIQINGHTDDVGSESDNQLLSEQRAKAIFDHLISSGISSHRLRYLGYGESRPIADNGTEDGRQQNRRTEFTIVRDDSE